LESQDDVVLPVSGDVPRAQRRRVSDDGPVGVVPGFSLSEVLPLASNSGYGDTNDAGGAFRAVDAAQG
jgi:hypothetical protein